MDDEEQNGAIRRSRPCFLVWGFVLFVVTFGVTPGARGTSYTIVTAPEEAHGEGKGINDSGQIVGFTAGANPQGFLSSGGSLTPISVPGALDTKPFDINNAGQIVGSNVLAFNGTQGFLYSGGHFTTIHFPGGTFAGTDALGINDAGVIVGFTGFLGEPVHQGILNSEGTFTIINPVPPGYRPAGNGHQRCGADRGST